LARAYFLINGIAGIGIVKRRQVMGWVAIVVIAVALLRLYVFFHPHPDRIDRRPHEQLGSVLAAEAVRALDGGGRLIVISRETSEFEVPAAEAQLDSFLAGIKKAGRTVTALRSVKVDPLRPLTVPAGDFFELLKQAKENDVIVSLLGPPNLSDEQVGKLGPKRPKVLAVCSGALPFRINLRKVFDQKLLAVAVVSRPDAPAVVPPGTREQAFEQTFKLITADNLAELNSLAQTGAREAKP
jgi:hypothetical protein